MEIQTSYKNKQMIQYSELFSDLTQFLIVFNKHVTDHQSFIEIKDYYHKFQTFILNHIKNTYKILQLPQSEIQRNLIRLNLSCTSNLLLKNNTVKQFDALKILRVLRNIVHKNVQIISHQQEFVINTYKVLFIQVFYQMFEIFNQLEGDIKKQLSLAYLPNITKGQTYLQILVNVNQSESFLRMWNANHILKQLENILFAEIYPGQNFRLLILDLEYAIPFQKPHQRKNTISYNDNDESLLNQ
ncbi:hypothetical protein FGO68_gene12896 [Halteria grandinella]|uniref:Uncharacterized protein n=1 Tax=Halteria grandinella TaxID=5974 RepID=A0A8J8NE19_HALGN|nr:hypothetical protein FGO68_gene12896 [Halteria grandinella]